MRSESARPGRATARYRWRAMSYGWRSARSLVSHKLCWLLVPLALLAMVATSATLFGRPLYAAALSLQTTLYALGIAGILSGGARRHSRLINACGTFCLLNLAALMALG